MECLIVIHLSIEEAIQCPVVVPMTTLYAMATGSIEKAKAHISRSSL